MTVKDTTVTAVISFVISSVMNLFSGDPQSEKIEEVIENNKNIKIINSEYETRSSSYNSEYETSGPRTS